jgi:threonine/homoserine/homoserine lactone efflux protein
MLIVFLTGALITFLISIPVGPVGMLCISQAIARGKWSGFVVGLGAAIVETFFAVVAAYSLTEYDYMFHIVSIVTLAVLSVYFFRKKSHIVRERRGSVKHIENMLISAFMNITNPFAIFGFFALFTMAGLGDKIGGMNSVALVVGVFVGACLWWYTLASLADHFEDHMNDNTFNALNKGFGILMIALTIGLAYKFAVAFMPSLTLLLNQ